MIQFCKWHSAHMHERAVLDDDETNDSHTCIVRTQCNVGWMRCDLIWTSEMQPCICESAGEIRWKVRSRQIRAVTLARTVTEVHIRYVCKAIMCMLHTQWYCEVVMSPERRHSMGRIFTAGSKQVIGKKQ
jgi:hypothetical protein